MFTSNLSKTVVYAVMTVIAIIGFQRSIFSQINEPMSYTPGGYFDKPYDHFGESYVLHDLNIRGFNLDSLNATGSGTEAGYFVLHFEDGSGFEGFGPDNTARRNVAEQVFADLSGFISSPYGSSSEKIHVLLRSMDSTHVSAPSGNTLRAIGSSYYLVPDITDTSVGSFIDGAVWKALQTGESAYTGITNQLNPDNLFFHGYLSVNFSNNAIVWNTDLTQAYAGVGESDLYTEILHQVLHMLGLHSLIDENGTSVFGADRPYYARYDRFLRTQSGEALIQPADSMCAGFNPYFALNDSLLSPDCHAGTPGDSTDCTAAIFFNYSIPVYTPGCFEAGYSLSHFEDGCYPDGSAYGNNLYFLMSNQNGTGAAGTKRWPRQEERDALCALGYTTAGTYGPIASTYHHTYNGTCNTPGTFAVNDGINQQGAYKWYGFEGDAIEISGFLNRNINTENYTCLEVIHGTGSITGQGAEGFNYTPTSAGIHLLRYTPLSAQNEPGNTGYLTVFSASSSCQPVGCNLIANGGFENGTVPCAQVTFADEEVPVSCWDLHSSVFRYFGRYCNSGVYWPSSYGTWIKGLIPTTAEVTSIPMDTWNGVNNDNFIGLRGGGAISQHQASVQQLLSTPLIAGNTYTISFRVMAADGIINFNSNPQPFNASDLNIAIVGNDGPSLSDITFPLAETNLLCPLLIVPAYGAGGPSWNYISHTFTIDNDLPDYDTFIIGHYGVNYAEGPYGYLLLDDIELIDVTVPSLTFPDSPCVSTLTDLEQYASHPNGSFTGTGVISNTDGTYDFFAPNTGDYTITYTLGGPCGFTISETINVGSMTTVEFNLPSVLCELSIPDLDQFVSLTGGVFSGPGVVNNGGVYSFEPPSPGDYTITYSITTGGCEFNLEQDITIYFPENVEIYLPSSLSCGEIVVFNSSHTTLPGGVWEGAPIEATDIGGSFIYVFQTSTPGSYDVTYTVTDENGCEIVVEGTIIVEGEISGVTIQFPVLSCNWTLENLEQYASVPGGTFTGNGVGFSSGVYHFTASAAGEYEITYSLSTTDGCSLQDIATITVLDPPDCEDDPIYITSNDTWSNVDMDMCADIIIAEGVNFIINADSELRFTAGHGIILEEGASLFVIDSELTVVPGCGPFWQGIYAEREANSTAPHSDIWIENSEISYAKIAIDAHTLDADLINTDNYWVTIAHYQSTFYNNKMDMRCFGLAGVDNGTRIQLRIIDTDYITNEDFPVLELPNVDKVWLRNVGGGFHHFRFINTRPDFLENLEYTAVKCAGTNHLGFHSFTLEIDSEISGFVRGISASNGISNSGTYTIRRVNFNNYRNMYFRSARTYIRENEVRNIPNDIMAQMNGIFLINDWWGFIHDEPGVMDVESSPYGLYLDGDNSSYVVHDNLFDLNTSIALGQLTHGIIANNTGQSVNFIQRNVFNNLRRSLKFQGSNRSTDAEEGVIYRCNIFAGNYRDVLITESIWSVENGIPHQGTEDIDFNNQFTQSTSPFDNIIDDIENWENTHNYFRTQSNAGAGNPLGEEVDGVNLYEATLALECAEISGLTLESGSYSELELQKTSAETAYESTNSLYQSLLDGGDTDELVATIATTGYNDALETYYDLMGQSPALSEEVMLEAIEQYNLPNVLLAEILASNPTAAKSDRIMESVDNRLVPFDEYQRNMVLQGLDIISNKETLEGEMRMRLADRSMALHLMIERIYADTTITHKVDSILPLFDETTYFNDTYIKANLLTTLGNYTAAIGVIEDAPLYHRLRGQNITDLDLLVDVLLIEETLFASGIDTLSAGDILLLEDAMYNTTAVVSERALNLLIAYAGYEYFEPIIEGHGAGPRSLVKPALQQPENDMVIYPNPARDLVIVEYQHAGVARIELVDINGKVVQNTSVNTAQHQFSLYLNKLAPGLYGIRLLSTSGSVIKQSKVIKQ